MCQIVLQHSKCNLLSLSSHCLLTCLCHVTVTQGAHNLQYFNVVTGISQFFPLVSFLLLLLLLIVLIVCNCFFFLGRTGTAICAWLIASGQFEQAKVMFLHYWASPPTKKINKQIKEISHY